MDDNTVLAIVAITFFLSLGIFAWTVYRDS